MIVHRCNISMVCAYDCTKAGIPDVQFWAAAAEELNKWCFIELELVSVFGELVKYNCVILYKAVLGWQQPQKPHYSVFYRAVWGVMNNVFLTGSYSKTYNSAGSAKDARIVWNEIRSTRFSPLDMRMSRREKHSNTWIQIYIYIYSILNLGLFITAILINGKN